LYDNFEWCKYNLCACFGVRCALQTHVHLPISDAARVPRAICFLQGVQDPTITYQIILHCCRHADHAGCSISDCRAAALRQPAAMCSGSAVHLCPPRDCQNASMQSCIASAIAAVQRCGCAPERMLHGRLRHIGCMMQGVRKSDVCDRDSATPLTMYHFNSCVDFIRNVAMHAAPCRGPEW